MKSCFETYTASEIFGGVAENLCDMREAIRILNNSLDDPSLRAIAISTVSQMAERAEVFCRDAEIAYGPTHLSGGVHGLLQGIGSIQDAK